MSAAQLARAVRLPPAWRRTLGIALPVAALGVLAAVVLARRDVFADALDSSPLWILGVAALRRSAPSQCPRVGALLAAEVPIVAIEVSLAALTSFTLLGPLGLPWWSAVLCFALSIAAVGGLSAFSRRHTPGLWSGLAILRSLDGRARILGLVLIAVFAQIARNWLALRAIGVDASVFDAIAVLIALVM